jgi:predicted HTH transcriptional regulator
MQTDINASLLQLIEKGEGENLEFKFEINDSRKIAETLCAFANTSGGHVVIGVKDNGSISGIRSSEEFHMIEGASQMYCKPAIPFTSKLYVVNKKEVLLVYVEEANMKPVFCINHENKQVAYKRIDDSNVQADPVTVQMWRKLYDAKRPAVYTVNEERILHLLDENEMMYVSKISNKAKIPFHKTIDTLAQLIVWDLIEPIIIHGKYFYKLK